MTVESPTVALWRDLWAKVDRLERENWILTCEIARLKVARKTPDRRGRGSLIA